MRGRRSVLTIAGTVAALMLTAGWITRDTNAQPSNPGGTASDVIMMRCNTAGASFTTTLFEGSTAAPAKRASNCPENLSILLKEGFTIRDVLHNEHDAQFVVYTLIR